MRKLHANSDSTFTGLATAIFSGIVFLNPLWNFSLIPLSANPKSKTIDIAKTENGKFFLTLLVSTFIVVGVFALTTGAQQIKERWYQPLLFYTPIIIALFSSPHKNKRNNWYIYIAAILLILVTITLPGRTLLAERFNRPVTPNIPYPAVMQSILNSTEKPDFILAESNLIGGNARPFFPDSIILHQKLSIEPKFLTGNRIIICESHRCENLTKFNQWLKANCAINTGPLEFNSIRAPYSYIPSKEITIFWSKINLTSPCKWQK